MGHYDDQREAAEEETRRWEETRLIQAVKAGHYDDLVSTAHKHNDYKTIIDSRVLARLLRAIRDRL
jgi:hypothetical protein